jgi:hypothetical protein
LPLLPSPQNQPKLLPHPLLLQQPAHQQPLRKTKSSLSKATKRPILKKPQSPLNQQRSNLALEDNDDEYEDVDESLQIGYRRRDLDKSRNLNLKLDDDDNLSDYVLVRLAVARAKAMEAYRNKWQS